MNKAGAEWPTAFKDRDLFKGNPRLYYLTLAWVFIFDMKSYLDGLASKKSFYAPLLAVAVVR